MSIIISEEREITQVIQGMKEMKEMKEMKGMPMEFMENGIQAKINEIYDYRMCFYDELNSEGMKDTFNYYSRDLMDDGFKLISIGIKKFYPGNCDVEYMNIVHKWYDNVDMMLLDLRITLMRKYNIDNPYTSVRNYKEGE